MALVTYTYRSSVAASLIGKSQLKCTTCYAAGPIRLVPEDAVKAWVDSAPKAPLEKHTSHRGRIGLLIGAGADCFDIGCRRSPRWFVPQSDVEHRK